MKSVFIKSGNQIFNREQICTVWYEEFSDQPNVIHVYTTDGGGIQFTGKNAEILWKAMSDSSLDLSPIEESE